MANTPTNQEKGDRLERAVRAIEQLILQSHPMYSDRSFRFWSKRILDVGGTHHEIDIWVEVDLGMGNRAVFIFGCKNWEEKVGKNEIIVFQEKVRVADAQRGFIVARSFTRDAVAQSAGDRRIELLDAEVLPTDNMPVPFDFHTINVQLVSVDGNVNATAAVNLSGSIHPLPRHPAIGVLNRGKREVRVASGLIPD